MKKSIRSFIAKLLVLCMVVGMLPAFSMAMGSTAAAADSAYTSDVDVKPTVSGTSATANVTSTSMNNSVNAAIQEAKKDGTDPKVEVNIKTPATATSLNVTLPATSLQKLAAEEGASLAINADNLVSVELDSVALDALAEKATGKVALDFKPATLTEAEQAAVGADATVIDLSISCGGTAITAYGGGNLTITLPYKLPTGVDAKNVVVYYLSDAGKLEACTTTYDATTGEVKFTTTHLSKYVIGTTSMNEVTLTATSTLDADVNGGEIVLTATGAAFAETAAAASFTLSDTGLTVKDVKVSGATATLTVTGTPAAGTLTVTVKKEAFDPAAAADATATITVAAPTNVTLTATSDLAVGVSGGTITLTTNGAAFVETAAADSFTLSDSALTVSTVKVDGKSATLTVTGTPAESETLTVTVKKEAITGAKADASVKLNVPLFTFDFTFETNTVEGKLVLNVGIEVYLRGNLLLTIPVVIPLD